MSLTWRALLPIFVLTITLMGFNQKANSQSESPSAIDSPNLRLLPNKSAPGLAQTPPSLQPTNLSEVPDSETSLLRALEVANSLKDPYLQATLFNDLAIKYANLGKSDRAREILDQSLEVARTIEDIVNQVTIMGAIALHYAEIGNLTIAKNVLAETVEIANSVEDKSLQAGLLSDLALKYAELGEQSPTETLLSQSEEILEQASLPVADFPFQPTPLQGRFTLGSGLSSGTRAKSNLTSRLQLEQLWETDDFLLDIDYKTDFDSSRSRDRYRTRIDVFGLYRHHFDETWQLFTLTTFERNIEDGIFYDLEPMVGPGINIFRQGTQRSLDIGVGLGVRYEDGVGKPDDTDVPTVGLVISYKDIFFDFIELDQWLLASWPVDDGADTRFGSLTDFSIPFGEKWSFTTRIRYIYRGDPPATRTFDDFTFTTGISYEF